MAQYKRPTIADREDEYRARRIMQVISPERLDPFADGRSHAVPRTLDQPGVHLTFLIWSVLLSTVAVCNVRPPHDPHAAPHSRFSGYPMFCGHFPGGGDVGGGRALLCKCGINAHFYHKAETSPYHCRVEDSGGIAKSLFYCSIEFVSRAEAEGRDTTDANIINFIFHPSFGSLTISRRG